MRLVPLSERCRVNENYTILNEGFGSYKLVVAGIVNDINNPRLSSARLASPGKVTVVQSEGTSLEVSSSNSNGSNSPDTDLIESKWLRIKLGFSSYRHW